MLLTYETLTQALLQAPSSPTPLIATATLDTYINNARLQVAAQGRCIRALVNVTLTPTINLFTFSQLTNFPAGVAGAYHIRQLWLQLPGTTGLVWLAPHSFEYFGLYALNRPVPKAGQPKMWSQLGQGTTGSIYIDPVPDLAYLCVADVLGEPSVLVDDTTVEAIPPLWTLAVPFYAAWYGYMSLQRQADADTMLKRFQEQMGLARNAANPDVGEQNWSQANDPMMANRLGVQPSAAASNA